MALYQINFLMCYQIQYMYLLFKDLVLLCPHHLMVVDGMTSMMLMGG